MALPPMSETIHYGPVWNKPRKSGESFSACDSVDTSHTACLTTHQPWVTCPDCKAILSSANEGALK